jgi:hypothetical protein
VWDAHEGLFAEETNKIGDNEYLSMYMSAGIQTKWGCSADIWKFVT